MFLSFQRSLINKTYRGGATGDVTLDQSGDRTNSAYEIYNLKQLMSGKKFLNKVGLFDQAGNMTVEESRIIWPGNRTDVPKGVFVSNHLRVSSISVENKAKLSQQYC